jgi:glycosyltransferase involved in cell wall biosynthesis
LIKIKILFHDYGGYSFLIQFSRQLAHLGYEVQHIYSGYNNSPRGEMAKKEDDLPNLTIKPLYTRTPLNKYSFIKRYAQENEFGRLVAEEIVAWQPDMVISANAPLDAQKHILRAATQHNARFVFWLQDLLGIASERILSKKIPILGKWIGKYYIHMEQNLLQRSDAILSICEEFVPLIGSPNPNVLVLPNWSPIEEIPLCPKENPWSISKGLDKTYNILYTGTLGYKQNPEMLWQLADHFNSDSDVRVVVVSEGLGAQILSEVKQSKNLPNLLVLPYQYFSEYPQVLASADVLVGTLDADAGIFSVPSKVLAYLCSGKPQVLACPKENLAARLIEQHQAGIVTPSGETREMIQAIDHLRLDPQLSKLIGENGRHYAEKHFIIKPIVEKVINFLQI